MQIELMGCTSAGKSTLARNALEACRERGIYAYMGDDFVLDRARLNWVKGHVARTLLVDLMSLFTCLMTWRRNQRFYRFSIGVLLRLPATVGWFEKVNIARNVFKKIGIYEIVRRRAPEQQVVLLDEGTLHTAHYLFVHASVEPDPGDLLTFARLVPLPDVAVYVRQDKPVLVERTLERGHKRIPDRSRQTVERFINRAVEVFERLAQQPALEGRLMVVDGRNESRSGSSVASAGSSAGESLDPSSALCVCEG